MKLYAYKNTGDGEDIERGGGGGGEVSVWDQKWKRERDGDGRDMRKTTHGWTEVHSLPCILATFPTSHAERSPLNLSAP